METRLARCDVGCRQAVTGNLQTILRPLRRLLLSDLLFALPSLVGATTNLSVWALPGSSGRLLYQPDAFGNRLLDYTAVGFSNGIVPIPDVPAVTNLAPVAGVDNGPRIQAAINYAATLPLVNGFRGAVVLAAGEYPISNSITIAASGIVLRGAGDGTNGTILRAAGSRPTADASTNRVPLIVIAGSGSSAGSGGVRNITNYYVPVGARSFTVDSSNGLAAGNRVFITRPSPTNWIHDIDMDLVSPAWSAGSFDVVSERLITRVEGNRIILDAPLTCALEARYGGGTIQKVIWAGRITNVGIEDIRGVSDFNPAVTSTTGATAAYYADELHAWTFVDITLLEHGWLRRATAQHFAYACVYLGRATRNFTVRDCSSLDPVSIITGERRYAFGMNDAELCLVQNCYTRDDRHQFVTGSLTTGPNVFVDGWSDNAFSDAGPHFRWGTGALWDNVTVNGNYLDIRNRGDLGTSHGWAGANEAVWNSKADAFIVESPVTARNWLIGSVGPLTTNTAAVGAHADGTYDSPGTNVFPNSLYYAQLQERLAAPAVQTRDYWLGDIDGFTNDVAGGEKVYLDTTWSNAVKSAAAGQPLDGFDAVTNNHWIPFTFSFSLATNESLLAATLSLAMRATNSAASNTLYIGTLTNGLSFTNLGWQGIGAGTNTAVRVLDLDGQSGSFATNQLNLAVKGDLGIDWAMLELQVATIPSALVTNALLPVADTFVRAGANATNNYGTNTTIEIKTDASADVVRQGFLRWDLSGISGRIAHARVRLMPTGVGTNGLEHVAMLVTNNVWSEPGITWNTQPAAGKRFASWIPAAGVPVEFFVTPQAQAAAADEGLLSLEIQSLSKVGGLGYATYAAREYGTAASRPQLILWVQPAPRFTNSSFTSTNLILSGTGPAGQEYRLFGTTNLSESLASWSLLATGAFVGGTFRCTNSLVTDNPAYYFRIITP